MLRALFEVVSCLYIHVLFVQTASPISSSLLWLLLKRRSVVMNAFEHRHLPIIKNKFKMS